jgi:hypothetical protein
MAAVVCPDFRNPCDALAQMIGQTPHILHPFLG